MINSVCHMVGYRNFDNKATNLQWVAFLTAGEGLHNNHHEYPTSALFALKRWEIDPAWAMIRILQQFGLAKVKPLPIAKAAA
jgi:stearoyl-CoA desaturase (delta-9 desaturase)